jgi:hypothetical protein
LLLLLPMTRRQCSLASSRPISSSRRIRERPVRVRLTTGAGSNRTCLALPRTAAR